MVARRSAFLADADEEGELEPLPGLKNGKTEAASAQVQRLGSTNPADMLTKAESIADIRARLMSLSRLTGRSDQKQVVASTVLCTCSGQPNPVGPVSSSRGRDSARVLRVRFVAACLGGGRKAAGYPSHGFRCRDLCVAAGGDGRSCGRSDRSPAPGDRTGPLG